MDNQIKLCLQGLPDELLLKILGYLSCNFRLASVSRVCHHFNELVGSFEMKSLDLKIMFPEKEILEMKRSARKKYPCYKLLRTFVDQPFDQTPTSWLPPSYDRFRRLFKHLEQHPKIFTEIRSMSLTVQDRSWYISCVQYRKLLRSLPHLDHLTLSPPPPMPFWLLVERPNHGPRALRSLRLNFLPLTAQFYRGDVYEDILNVIDYYRYCSGLHKLRIDGLCCINVDFTNERMTFIKDLWFVGCRQCEAVAMTTQLIRASTGLVRYIFETDTDRSRYRPFPPEDPSFLYNDLLMHKRTLRQLVIATSKLGVIHETWTLGPLNSFSQLEKVALPCFMLPVLTSDEADFKMLPPKLEELQLEYPFNGNPLVFDNENRLEMFRRWTDQMKSRLPYLRRLIFWYQGDSVQMAERNSGMFDPAILKTLQVLEQTFNELDISLEWLSVSSFWDTPVGKALDAEGDVIIEEKGGDERDLPTLHPTSSMV